ncbi:golgin subfamily A member 6-like protein 6 [Sardina pilchardus]|uniref:golgin subfamily A member 6-like protein 6 n=1 Tax=Sardina pilchardus TaxID=27697 RepID=UPI002E0FC240
MNLQVRKHAAALEDISSLEKVVRELQQKEGLEMMKIEDPIGLLLGQKRMEFVQMENLTQRMRQLERENQRLKQDMETRKETERVHQSDMLKLERENQHLQQDMETRREVERVHQSNMLELERRMNMLEQVSGQQITSLHSINEEMSQRLRQLETGNLIMNQEMKAFKEKELKMNIKMIEQHFLSQQGIASYQKMNGKLLQRIRKLEAENWMQKQERALEIKIKMKEKQLTQQQIASLQKINDKLCQRMSKLEMENWWHKQQMDSWRARELQEREMTKCNKMKELEMNSRMTEQLLQCQQQVESLKTMNETFLQKIRELETDSRTQKKEMETLKAKERQDRRTEEQHKVLDTEVHMNLLKDKLNMHGDPQQNGRQMDKKWQGFASETDKITEDEQSHGDGGGKTCQLLAMEETARPNAENTLLKSPVHGDHSSAIVGNVTAKSLPSLQDGGKNQPNDGSEAAMETSVKRKKKTNRQKATDKRKEKAVQQLEMDRQKTEKEKEMRDEARKKATLIQRLEEERLKALAEVAAMMKKVVLK